MPDVIDIAKKYIGIQETDGPNRGPLVDKWKGAVSKGLAKSAIPWCGCFVFAMLAETAKLDRRGLTRVLGFSATNWWPESTDSWLAQAKAPPSRLTKKPERGDLFLLMRKLPSGGYSKSDAIHIGFYEAGAIVAGSPFQTVEGNTIAVGTGAAAREGNSVAARTRIYEPNGVLFISLPQSLKVAQ